MKFIFKKSKKTLGDQKLKTLSLHPLLQKAAFQKRLKMWRKILGDKDKVSIFVTRKKRNIVLW